MKRFLIFLLLVSAVFAFSIESYYSDVSVLENGDLHVYEKMTFELEEAYNEGYRSIRPQDAGWSCLGNGTAIFNAVNGNAR